MTKMVFKKISQNLEINFKECPNKKIKNSEIFEARKFE